MKFADFEVVALALYGRRWRSYVAADVGVSYQAVANWAKVGAVPDRVIEPLRVLVRDRFLQLRAARRLLWSRRRVAR